MRERPVGRITHYWPKAHAAALHLDEELHVGDKVRIVGHGHDFVQEVTSLEVGHEPHAHLWKGDVGSLGVQADVHRGDTVLRLEREWKRREPRYPLFELQG